MLQENSFFKDQHLVRLKDYYQVQLVLMVYIVSQNTSLEPAQFPEPTFSYYSYPVQYHKSVASLFPKHNNIDSCGFWDISSKCGARCLVSP